MLRGVKVLGFIGRPLFDLLYFFLKEIFSYYIAFRKSELLFYKKRGGILVSFTTLFLLFGAYVVWTLSSLPSVGDLEDREVNASTRIYDRNGILLYTLFEDENRILVASSQIPEHIKLATIAAEDSEFYSHWGVSAKGIARGLYKSVVSGRLVGGSTITQQLIKNTLLTRERTVRRKVSEIVLAVLAERKYGKDKILEMYLNEVSYGGTAYGIQAGARYYFNKDVALLSMAEGAFLAGLPKSPTALSPYGENLHVSLSRKDQVLGLMKKNNFISNDVYEEALSENLIFVERRNTILAPHFVFFVRDWLEREYGENVAKLGLQVHTTIDMGIQSVAEAVLDEELEKARLLNLGNGGVLVMNPKNGAIMAMVGSRDFFNVEQDGQVNVITSLQQPGSAIKPVNYAYALSNGATPASRVDDSPITFRNEGQEEYTPVNYDGKYRGSLSLRAALAESRNIPAVKVLSAMGVSNMIETGRKMGIDDWNDSSNYGLSLTLGGGEVKLIDLAQVYSTIANEGRRVEPFGVSRIVDSKGETIYTDKCYLGFGFIDECNGEQVLDPRVAYQLIDILSDNEARAPSFGRFSNLVIPGHPEVAVKTGTSNALRDNVTVGFNQDYLTAVWVGNNDNSPMKRVASGLTGASSIWNRVMVDLIGENESKKWSLPTGLTQVKTCAGRAEWFLEENVQPGKCGHFAAGDERRGLN